jgi:hypothetical protein
MGYARDTGYSRRKHPVVVSGNRVVQIDEFDAARPDEVRVNGCRLEQASIQIDGLLYRRKHPVKEGAFEDERLLLRQDDDVGSALPETILQIVAPMKHERFVATPVKASHQIEHEEIRAADCSIDVSFDVEHSRHQLTPSWDSAVSTKFACGAVCRKY